MPSTASYLLELVVNVAFEVAGSVFAGALVKVDERLEFCFLAVLLKFFTKLLNIISSL